MKLSFNGFDISKKRSKPSDLTEKKPTIIKIEDQ